MTIKKKKKTNSNVGLFFGGRVPEKSEKAE
jgi:hypothetical protein